ncbi:hypothetical protein FJ471_08510 [Mesorhizobium sp. B2-7-1]|nr:hypothetical protein FJ471_08510 [Mesorhizobium sp. B2-7-1]
MEPADRRLDADVPCRAAGVGQRNIRAKLSEIGPAPRGRGRRYGPTLIHEAAALATAIVKTVDKLTWPLPHSAEGGPKDRANRRRI